MTIRFLPLLCSLALLTACSDNAQQQISTADRTVAEMIAAAASNPNTTQYQDLNGQGFDISAFAGKKVFLNYWATWCAPCIREIPAIARAAATLEPENYVFLLASDESPEKIRDFLAERGFDGNFIKLNGYFGSHGIDAVPSSLLYNTRGEQVHSWAGAYEWDNAEMLAEIRSATP